MTEVYLEPCQTSIMDNFAGVLKKGVLKNLVILIEKYLCRSLFLNKVAGLNFLFKKTCNFIKKETFKDSFFTEHLRVTVSIL